MIRRCLFLVILAFHAVVCISTHFLFLPGITIGREYIHLYVKQRHDDRCILNKFSIYKLVRLDDRKACLNTSKFASSIPPLSGATFLRNSVAFLFLRRVYCNFCGGVSDGETWIVIDCLLGREKPYKEHSFIGEYDKVLLIGHYFTSVYGHFILDLIVPLILLPRTIVTRYYVPFAVNRTFYVELLTFAGVDPSRLIFPIDGSKTSMYYADKALCLKGPDCRFNSYAFTTLLRNKILNAYNISSINHYRNVLYNRLKSRKISNFGSLVEAVKTHFPGIDFQTNYDVSFPSIRELAYYWSSVKILVAIQGSNLQNTMFMSNSCGCVVLNTKSYDKYWIFLAMLTRYWVINSRNDKFPQWGRTSGYNVNVNGVLYALKQLLYAMKNHMWSDIKYCIFKVYSKDHLNDLHNEYQELKSEYSRAYKKDDITIFF